MSDYLAVADDLSSFPGSPFDEFLVEIAQASVRSDAGWHIAPVRSETLYLFSDGETYLAIPSLRVVSIDAVRYGAELTEYTSGWTQTRGGLYLAAGWTAGPVEVDITHGYAETPLDLLPVIVNRVRNATNPRDPSQASYSVSSGPFRESESYRSDMPTGVDPRIARYALPPGVA